MKIIDGKIANLGALIVVDVLEGICTQTHAVVYKALRERLRPCLVLNKIDRLAVEMRLSTVEAFHHLRRLVENVNVTIPSHIPCSLYSLQYAYISMAILFNLLRHTQVHTLSIAKESFNNINPGAGFHSAEL